MKGHLYWNLEKLMKTFIQEGNFQEPPTEHVHFE